MSLRFRLALWIAVAETVFLAIFLLADIPATKPIDLSRTSLVFLIGMGINGQIAMTIAHVFTRRLSELADAADAIAAGNPHYYIVAAGDDDIARLGRAFNNIVARMESHLQHVKESRDRLIKPTEAMSEGFALWDRNDRLLLCNKQFRKIFKPIDCSIRPGISFSLFARLVSDWFMHTEIRPSIGPQRGGLVERVGSTNAAILDAVDAMESHVAEPIPLDDLAGAAGISPRQLNRLFREKLGRSTMGYYRELRLDKAQSLLRHSPLSLTEIALATGFANSSHFSRAYTQHYGQPPSANR